MKKISNMMNRLVARKEDAKADENGFSLLELVVAIGILLVLTVGGLIGYSVVTDNARSAAANSAASEIATSVKVALSDEDGTNNKAEAQSVIDAALADNAYKGVNVTLTGDDPGPFTITAEHSKQVDETHSKAVTRTITK